MKPVIHVCLQISSHFNKELSDKSAVISFRQCGGQLRAPKVGNANLSGWWADVDMISPKQ